jgi:SpoVK/Ycf46/Vps4 family AAA+-type ATPase
MLQHTVHGLSVVDTSFDFYDVPKGIAQWMTMSLPYLNHPQLAPRGLLLVGKTGVGKTTAPKYIAKSLNLPLYRLDIADALDKWTGVSEHRVSRALQIVDRESPAVLLIDEVEKIFGGQNEAVERILSQLLWWLAEHRTQVITIMTTNNISKLPQELYRPGRVDQVIHLRGLGRVQAFEFALEVLATLPLNLESSIQDAIHAEIHDAYDGGTITDISHAEIRQVVIDFVRRKGLVSS